MIGLYRRRRRGAVLLIVLAFLATTLAVSYAFIRTESTEAAIGSSASRRQRARSAAWSGAMFALRDLHSAQWAGVDTTIHRDLSGDTSFAITYRAGDASALQSGDDDEYPFRVTVEVQGTVAPETPGEAATVHRMQLVVQLVRRALSPEPIPFDRFNHRSVLQWDAGRDVEVEWPVQIKGRTEFQGALEFFVEYPAETMPLGQYLYDLNRMRQAGRGDYRPFQSVCRVGPQAQGTRGAVLLAAALGVTLVPIGTAETPSLAIGSVPSTYQLYPGGPQYAIPLLPSTVEDLSLEPDPVENPLGIFRYTRSVRVRNGVSAKGTWLGDGPTLKFRGTDINLEHFVLPSLVDDDTPYALPTLSSRGTIKFRSRGSITVSGFIHSESRIQVESTSSSKRLDITGRLATARFEVERRNDWPRSQSWWDDALADWQGSGEAYFPEYLADHEELAYVAPITIKPPTDGVRYHWQDWNLPVYAPHPDDPGLRWTLIRWTTEIDP